MTGITNRPKAVEDENQERVEERKTELTAPANPDHSDKQLIEKESPRGDNDLKEQIGLGPNHEGPKAP